MYPRSSNLSSVSDDKTSSMRQSSKSKINSFYFLFTNFRDCFIRDHQSFQKFYSFFSQEFILIILKRRRNCKIKGIIRIKFNIFVSIKGNCSSSSMIVLNRNNNFFSNCSTFVTSFL